jgi:hypothetical protein
MGYLPQLPAKLGGRLLKSLRDLQPSGHHKLAAANQYRLVSSKASFLVHRTA